jgi:beta-phosphoglucomutase-like phosphatase (HAD superfamily)
MTRTQAIVFDMDGVLIDSEELHAHAKRIAFAHAGIALSDTDLSSYVGPLGTCPRANITCWPGVLRTTRL